MNEKPNKRTETEQRPTCGCYQSWFWSKVFRAAIITTIDYLISTMTMF